MRAGSGRVVHRLDQPGTHGLGWTGLGGDYFIFRGLGWVASP